MEYPTYLIHYGVPGQKWGVRQYQLEDGTWTEEGLRRRRIGEHDYGSSDLKTGKGPVYSKGEAKGNFVESIKKDVETINGGKRGHEYGFNRKENCAFCTMSYELRRRGYDVRAQESIQGVTAALSHEEGAYGKVIPNYSKVSSSARTYAQKSFDGMSKSEYDKMVNDIVSDGNSRGFISCNWKDGMGGHIFNYEVNNGKLYFIDSQAGEIKDADIDFFRKTLKNAFNIETLRSDNIKINEEKAKKYYSEDTISNIEINKIKKSKNADIIASTIIATAGGVVVSAAIVAATGYVYPLLFASLILGAASRGVDIGEIVNDIKSSKPEAKHTEELKKKWEEEGRIKDKWYELSEKKKNDKVNTLPDAKQSRIKALVSSGKTQEEVARIMGVSLSTVKKYK